MSDSRAVAILGMSCAFAGSPNVGGVHSICSPEMMVAFSKIGALSRHDICRPFDSAADGVVLGQGVGAAYFEAPSRCGAEPEISALKQNMRASSHHEANLLLNIGRGNQLVHQTQFGPPAQDHIIMLVLNLLGHSDDLAAEFLNVIGQLAVLGLPIDLSLLHYGAKPVSPPGAPLPARVCWVADPKKRQGTPLTRRERRTNNITRLKSDDLPYSNTVQTAEPLAQAVAADYSVVNTEGNVVPKMFSHVGNLTSSGAMRSIDSMNSTAMISPREAVGSPACLSEKESEILGRLLELIAAVSGYLMESLKPEHRLGADLGFDSSMTVDLKASLSGTFEEAALLPKAMIGGETTVKDLAHAVAELTVRRAVIVDEEP